MKLVTYLALIATCEVAQGAHVNLQGLIEAAASEGSTVEDDKVDQHEKTIKKINKEVQKVTKKMKKVVDKDSKDSKKSSDKDDKDDDDDDDDADDNEKKTEDYNKEYDKIVDKYQA